LGERQASISALTTALAGLALLATLAAAGNLPVTLPDKPNPHGRRQLCGSCHDDGAPAARNFRPASCTECHDPQAHLREVHPTDFAGDSPKAPAFPGARLVEGRATCLTCHEIVCNGETDFRVARENRAMLSGGPWPRETDFCYQCHERALYRAVMPHRDAADRQLCWYCHAPREGVQPVEPGPELQLLPPELCNKCHKDNKHERQHIGRSVLSNHLKTDTAAALRRFQESTGVTLPLGPGDTVRCTTCHNPNPACGGGPQESRLLRAAKERICYACHDL
jgi:predicted CXXCH cytochrome family protein